jgi:hypothetical protein
MPKIYSYQKAIDNHTTHTVKEPDYRENDDRITELCTVGSTTYISVPDSIVLPIQPEHIMLKEEVLTPELKAEIKGLSPHIQLINQRVRDKIADKYPIYYEIKALRKKDEDKAAFDAYDTYAEACVAWGSEEKKKLGM